MHTSNKFNTNLLILIIKILYTLFFACSAFSLPLGLRSTHKLAEAPKDLPTYTLKEVLEKSLTSDISLKLTRNQLELGRAQKISHVAALLPKIKASVHYVKNIPKSKVTISQPDDSLALIAKKLATIINNSNDKELLENASDKMLRRPIVGDIITRPTQAFEGTLSLILPLFNAPDIAKILLINNSLKIDETRVDEQKADTLFLSAQAYLDADYYKKLRELRTSQSQNAEKEYIKLTKRFKKNLVSDIQIIKSQLSYDELKLAALSAEHEYNNSLAVLGFLIGERHNFAITEPDFELFRIPSIALEQSDEQLISIAELKRSDLRVLEHRLNAAKREHIGSMLQFLPNLFIQADAHYTTNTKGFVGQPWSYTVLVGAHYEFFSGGSSIGALKESSLKKLNEKLKLDDCKQKIAMQIRGRRASLQRAMLALKAQQARVSYTSKLEIYSLGRYSQNKAQIDEWLDALQLKNEAEVELLKAETQLKRERLAQSYELGLLTLHEG